MTVIDSGIGFANAVLHVVRQALHNPLGVSDIVTRGLLTSLKLEDTLTQL